MTDLSISVAVLSAGDGACTVVRLAGEADVTTTELRDALAAEITLDKPRLVLVDMTALTFMDSAAIQVIIAAYQVFRRDGGTLALAGPTLPVSRALELLGVGQLIPVYDSVDHAVTCVRGPRPMEPPA
jgi:anti-sigma B factor antagonist